MTDQTEARERMREMGLTDEDLARRKKFVGLEPSDIVRIAAIRPAIVPRVDSYTAMFFDHLAALEEARGLHANRDVLARARRMKTEHLIAMVGGDHDLSYVEQRVELALLYSRAGLEPRVFLGAFHRLLAGIGSALMREGTLGPTDAFESFMSLKKLAFLDVAVIVDVLAFERDRVIADQQEAIRELSTPVLRLSERLLLLPLIGAIDTARARLITDSVLRSIRASRAEVVVMDVTGVASIDSRVANHLLQTVSAARLMGATVVITGLSTEVASSLVVLGVDVSRFNTAGDLREGLAEAQRLLGRSVVGAELS